MNRIIALALLATLLSVPASAQDVAGEEASGTAAAQYLLLPMTARTAALGTGLTGGIHNLSGVEALQANPAALMVNGGTNVLFSRTEYVADIGINYFGFAQRVGNSNIAFTVTAWDFGDIPLTTEENPDPSSLTWTASTIVVSGTYARQFTDRIAAGITVKAISEGIDDVNGSAVAFDAGMTYVVGESGLRFGVALKNFGPQMTWGGNGLNQIVIIDDNDQTGFPTVLDADDQELPSLLTVGATYSRTFSGDVSISALGNFRSNAYEQDEFSGGLELGYADMIYVRGGVQLLADMDLTFYNGWNVGGGLNLDLDGTAIAADYAYRSTDFFDGVHMFTVGLTL